MKQFRLLLKTVVFAAVALSMSLQANISPLAFNGIFKCFKPGYEMYAPTLGCAALQTGFVHALRFYTTIPGGNDAAGRRMWINDQAPANDPVAALVLLLFPSPAGNLTAMTSNPENIGRHLTVHDVAQLLNFCTRVRTAVHAIKKNRSLNGNQFGKNIKNTLKLICQALDTTTVDEKNLYQNKSLDSYFRLLKIPEHFLRLPNANILLSILYRCIELEERDDRQKAFAENPLNRKNFECYHENRFYPKYIPETLLNAFFCLKFGKDDIPELLKNLNDSLVDQDQFINTRLINKTDIQDVVKKDINDISLDNLWVIQNRDLIDQVVPYSRGCKPVNNGLASAYNRAQDLFLNNKNQEFPDCTETTIRHLCNLVLFHHKDGSFNLEKALSQLKNSDIKNLSGNLEAFYSLQSPDKANSGERSIRDAWAKVVGDLGKPVCYRKKLVSTNAYNDTEVASGIINILRVLNIIFNLGLDPEPVYENDQQFAERVTEWAQNSLQKLFKIITPEKEVNIQISEVRAFRAFGNYEYDCSGKIDVTVNQDFKFTISVRNGHAQFDTIDILVPEQASINNGFLNQVTNKFQNDFSTTIGESIFLLNNKTKNLVKIPAYKFFKNGVHDSAQIINALEVLLEMTQNNEIPLTFSGKILKNFLHNFLWQDQIMTIKIQPILKKWTNFAVQSNNQGIKNALQNEVQYVQYDVLREQFNDNADDLLDFFHQAKTIFCSWKNTVSVFSLFKNHESIKTIDLLSSCITELDISSDTCPNLENLYLLETRHLKRLTLSGRFQNLKSIKLSESAITKLEIHGDTCPNLEVLYLSSLEKLKNLKLFGVFQNLESMDLSYSGVTELDISGGRCPNLENLDLYGTIELNNFKLSGIFQNIKKIDLSESAVSELEISGDTCPSLESIFLRRTNQLKNLNLTEVFQNLKFIDLSFSGITDLEISGDICPNLEQIYLYNTIKLINFKISGILHSLKGIQLSGSAIYQVIIFQDCCPNFVPNDLRIKIIDRKNSGHDWFYGTSCNIL